LAASELTKWRCWSMVFWWQVIQNCTMVQPQCTLCSEKNTHSHFVLYLCGKCSFLQNFQAMFRRKQVLHQPKIRYFFGYWWRHAAVISPCF